MLFCFIPLNTVDWVGWIGNLEHMYRTVQAHVSAAEAESSDTSTLYEEDPPESETGALSGSGIPSTDAALRAAGLVDIQEIDPTILVELKYATSDNFTGRPLYRSSRCYLQKDVALRLAKVQKYLRLQGLGLKIWDGYRPLSVQRELWKAASDKRFIADPRYGSNHNRGAAVDCTLVNLKGEELPMPSRFDSFNRNAHRWLLSMEQEAHQNSIILEAAMRRAGFVPLAFEWWHFDAPDARKYPVLDIPL